MTGNERPRLCPHCAERIYGTEPHCRFCDWFTCSRCAALITRWTHAHEEDRAAGHCVGKAARR